MYAVIASGGKQEKVAEGQQVRVELLDAEDGSDVSLTPVMVVDGSDRVRHARRAQGCHGHRQGHRPVKGPKINGYTFKKRTNQHRRYGHRQKYHVVEITSISI